MVIKNAFGLNIWFTQFCCNFKSVIIYAFSPAKSVFLKCQSSQKNKVFSKSDFSSYHLNRLGWHLWSGVGADNHSVNINQFISRIKSCLGIYMLFNCILLITPHLCVLTTIWSHQKYGILGYILRNAGNPSYVMLFHTHIYYKVYNYQPSYCLFEWFEWFTKNLSIEYCYMLRGRYITGKFECWCS